MSRAFLQADKPHLSRRAPAMVPTFWPQAHIAREAHQPHDQVDAVWPPAGPTRGV